MWFIPSKITLSIIYSGIIILGRRLEKSIRDIVFHVCIEWEMINVYFVHVNPWADERGSWELSSSRSWARLNEWRSRWALTSGGEEFSYPDRECFHPLLLPLDILRDRRKRASLFKSLFKHRWRSIIHMQGIILTITKSTTRTGIANPIYSWLCTLDA